ncbi:MAG: peptide chain release factor N(5)-glutamine methyltransferase [Clostridiales bacterium]|nr:peptide chain release factor N(5)-glutamine methyltransferase [Clostridiales bacterium]
MSKELKKQQKKQGKNQVSIGGQAVLEGVMMRGENSMATAVRDQDGIIRVESVRVKPVKQRNPILRLPLVRGVVSFLSSLVGGSKVLMRSAEVFGEEEPSKFEKFLADKFKINIMSVVTTVSLILGLGLAILLFMFLPQLCREGLEKLFNTQFDIWAKSFIEGGLKLLIFVAYIMLASLLKDIKRTFMYHGAEHKTISCFESGMPLTVENAKKCTRIHDRCGTTFMVFVMLISIILFAVVESLIGDVEQLYRVLLKIALLPVVAGLSYELLKLLAKTKSPLVFPLKIPGMLLQKITTKNPTDDMLEVAIVAFNTVYEMDRDPTIKEKQFIVSKKRCDLLKEVKQTLLEHGITENAESEWIISLTLGVKRDELDCETMVSPKYIEKINSIVEQRITGRPLWYCIGDVDFYGYTLKVDERVLIPRPETEILVENALKNINKDSKVLDLCTGSGAIAIAVAKESGASVVAVDISQDAITLASENAKLNGVDVEFIVSNMFENISEQKFDVIISNPPYIKSQDILTLQKEVKDFEPNIALDGGQDGYDFYNIICEQAKNHLSLGGVLLLECGLGQAQCIKNMLKDFTNVEIIKDYENIDRIVKAVL